MEYSLAGKMLECYSENIEEDNDKIKKDTKRREV